MPSEIATSAPSAVVPALNEVMSVDVLRESLRGGLEVVSSDGQRIGRTVRAWYGDDPGERHSLPQREAATGVEDPEASVPDAVVEVLSEERGTLYVPHQAIGSISEGQLTLRVDRWAVGASSWDRKPPWMLSDAERQPVVEDEARPSLARRMRSLLAGATSRVHRTQA